MYVTRPMSSPSPSKSTPLPIQYRQFFRQHGHPVQFVSDLISGVKLAEVINQVFYDNLNNDIRKTIKYEDQQRKGNNVINMNVVLKHLKNNNKVAVPQQIKNLSSFNLLESDEEILKLLDWLFKSASILLRSETKENINQNFQRPHKVKVGREESALKTVQNDDENILLEGNNGFQNVFFCDRDISPSKVNMEMNDSLQISQKISKKGSFKIVRPRSNFDDNESKKQIYEDNVEDAFDQQQKKSMKTNAKVENNKNGQNFQRFYSQEKDVEARKTVPKMAERPPIYRKINKQETKNQPRNQVYYSNVKQPNPFLIEQKSNNQSVQNLMVSTEPVLERPNIQSSILKIPQSSSVQLKKQKFLKLQSDVEQLDLAMKIQKPQFEQKVNSNETERSRQNSKNSRKLFKVNIQQTNEGQRKLIIEWLISINLLSSIATNYIQKFHQICKNGVIFSQIINFHRGKCNEISYCKNPVKSAQMHSNYQKVFACLKQIPNFQSQLLFLYDYFVPEVLENAFWSLLKSCYFTFCKGQNKSKVYTRDSKIRQRMKTKPDTPQNETKRQLHSHSHHSSAHKLSKVQLKNDSSKQYNKIKYGSAKMFKQNHLPASVVSVQKQTPSRQSKIQRKSSLQFIKELPQKMPSKFKQQQLVQVCEPQETTRQIGYRQLHELRKNHHNSSFINTPKKKVQTSMNNSRLASYSQTQRNSCSVKKIQNSKPQQPSVTLQMEMKSMKYLKQKKYIDFSTLDSLPLFDDPIRNGTLINKIIIEQTKIPYRFITKPKNIMDCRQNFKKAFQQLKQSLMVYSLSFEYFSEQIIKGQLSLFYGLVYNIVINKPQTQSHTSRQESAVLSISKNNPYSLYTTSINQQQNLSQVLFWIRELEQQNPQISSLKIRDHSSLTNSVISHNLLYTICPHILSQKYALKPVYEKPVTQIQQQSNIKKILSFYAHNKAIKNDQIWRARAISKRQISATVCVMQQLMNYYKSTHKNSQNGISNQNLRVQMQQKQNPVVSFVKYIRPSSRESSKQVQKGNKNRLQTTMANNSFAPHHPNTNTNTNIQKHTTNTNNNINASPVQIPWMRHLGFTCPDLSLNNGVILCRLVSKLTMQNLNYNQNPQTKAQCLMNIRRAIKCMDKFKWDQQDIFNSDHQLTVQVYKFIKDKYKHSYAMKSI